MNDRYSNGPADRAGDGHGSEVAAAAEAFAQALHDAMAGHANYAGLNAEEQDLLAAISDWLPGLPEALANLELAAESDVATEQPIRPDDPIAQMLGLAEDSAISLDGKLLASVRKAAGLNIADLAGRLQRRGWDVSVKTVSAWERNLTNPPPATINAISEELDVAADVLLASSRANAQTLDVLFDDELITAFLDEWAREANVPARTLAAQSKRLLATAGKRNATSATPETLLAILRHFKNLPGFESSE
jgi:transcriptional regulator with XRE-family HTH domain